MTLTRYVGSMKDFKSLVAKFSSAVSGLRHSELALRESWTDPVTMGPAIQTDLAALIAGLSSNYLAPIGFYSDFQTFRIDTTYISANIGSAANSFDVCDNATPFSEIKALLDADHGAIVIIEVSGLNDASSGDVANAQYRLKYDAANTGTKILLESTIAIGGAGFYAGSGLSDNASYSPSLEVTVVGVEI